MQTFLLMIHVLAAAGVIGLVLLQHGKGADMGAAFGSGSAGSLFGASGSANFLSRSTAVLTALFFVTSLGLTYLSTGDTKSQGVVLDRAGKDAPSEVPALGPVVPSEQDSPAKEIPK
jgi:preprotein translocase subunit SecG